MVHLGIYVGGMGLRFLSPRLLSPSDDQRDAPAGHHRRLVAVAWVAMLLMSRLPQIVFQELLAVETSFVWTSIGVAAALTALTYVWPALRPLRGYCFVTAVVVAATGLLGGAIQGSSPWAAWFGEARGWPVSFLGTRLPLLIESLIVLAVLIGMGVRRREDVFLAVGDLRAPASRRRLPGIGSSWLAIGSLIALALAALAFAAASVQAGAALPDLATVLPWLPAVVLLAIINAFGEEFLYRAAPLSQLHSVVGTNHAVGLTAVWFGLGHFYGGVPSGVPGALMTGLIALLFGKAMLATRGIALPTFMHMLGDVVIYVFLARAAMGA